MDINASEIDDVEQSFAFGGVPAPVIKFDQKIFNQAHDLPLTSTVQLPQSKIERHPLKVDNGDYNDFSIKQLKDLVSGQDSIVTVQKEKPTHKGKPYRYLFDYNEEKQHRPDEDPD